MLTNNCTICEMRYKITFFFATKQIIRLFFTHLWHYDSKGKALKRSVTSSKM